MPERRAPSPWKVIIAGTGFPILEETDDKGRGQGWAWSQEQMPFSPGQPTPLAEPYTYDKEFEVAQSFNNFRSGVGFRQQGVQIDRDIFGIWKGDFIDKYGDYWGNAPAVTQVTPSTTDAVNGGNGFQEFTVGSTNTWLCLMGEYVLQRTADTAAGWGTNAHDLGAGMKITGWAVYRGTQARDMLYVAFQNSSGVAQTYAVWDGTSATTTWTTDTVGNKAVDFVVFRDALWRLYQDGQNRWCISQTLQGGTGVTWLAPFVIADNTNPCRHFVIDGDILLVRSQKGLLETTNDLYYHADIVTGSTFILNSQTLNECKPIAFGGDNVIAQNASAWYRYKPSTGEMHEIGPATLKDTDDQTVIGVVTANVPYRDWTVYYAMYNATASKAFIMRWGEWEHISTTFSPVDHVEFLPSHIGSQWEQTAQINGMGITEIGGTPKLYFVDASGVISSMPLGRFNTNFQNDSGVTYNTANPFQMYMPGIHAHIPHVDKVHLGVELNTKNASGSSRYADVTYRLDAVSAYGNGANLQNSGRFNGDPGSRNDFTVSVVSKWIDFLVTGTTTTASTPMLVDGFTEWVGVRPVMRWVYEGTLLLASDAISTQGQNRRRTLRVEDQLAFLVSQAAAGVISIVTPDGSTVDVLMTKLGKARIINWEPTQRPDYACDVQFMQHRATTSTGTEARISSMTELMAAAYSETGLVAF